MATHGIAHRLQVPDILHHITAVITEHFRHHQTTARGSRRQFDIGGSAFRCIMLRTEVVITDTKARELLLNTAGGVFDYPRSHLRIIPIIEMSVITHAIPVKLFRRAHNFVRAEVNRLFIANLRPARNPALPEVFIAAMTAEASFRHAVHHVHANIFMSEAGGGEDVHLLRMLEGVFHPRYACGAGFAVSDAADAILVKHLVERRQRQPRLRILCLARVERFIIINVHQREIARRPSEGFVGVAIVRHVSFRQIFRLAQRRLAVPGFAAEHRRTSPPDGCHKGIGHYVESMRGDHRMLANGIARFHAAPPERRADVHGNGLLHARGGGDRHRLFHQHRHAV
ncbi:MAG: hypothetical protein BWY76_01338 [bacterium ADurb.Bin429]|nr:MAG: hypothetical protein BWY76_01338 [bacterium ADurb.Bin429]